MSFDLSAIGRWLFIGGLGLAALGALLFVAGKVPFLNRLGSLPGDIRYQSAGERLSCFAPVASSIVISVILTIVLNVVVRLLNR